LEDPLSFSRIRISFITSCSRRVFSSARSATLFTTTWGRAGSGEARRKAPLESRCEAGGYREHNVDSRVGAVSKAEKLGRRKGKVIGG
jgi:hypothetical protein